MPPIRFALLVAAPLALLATAPLPAQPGYPRPDYWGTPGRWEPIGRYSDYRASDRRADPREGKVKATHFLADSPAIAALGHGRIIVSSAPGSMEQSGDSAAYEAAVVDQLVKAGYETAAGANGREQVAELVMTRDTVQPEEPPRKPVSGEVGVGFGTRGSSMGVAVNVDLRKPLKALVATQLNARIRDRATNELLWEGRSTIITREGERRWSTETIATRLAAALFEDFPGKR